MIDFTSTQLSWIFIAACSVGGTGYMTMDSKVNEIDKKLAVTINTMENNNQKLETLLAQLNRVEEKIENPTKKR